MAELSLRQQIARNEYERNYKPQLDLLSGFAGEVKWNSPYAASARINCLNYADSIISLMLAKVDKVKNPYFNRGGYDDTASSVGFNEALQAIKSILEGK